MALSQSPPEVAPIPGPPPTSGVRSGALLAVASAVSIVAAYAFLLAAGRILGSDDYGSLAALLGILAIVLIPLAIELFQVLLGVPLQMSARSVAWLVSISVIAPLAVGILIRTLSPALAESAAGPTATLGAILLAAGMVALLITQGERLVSTFGPSTFAALGAFSAFGLLIGHLLGGPRFEDRAVLALYASARHPGVAIAIAQANFPEEKTAVIAILLALLIGGIVSLPYTIWIKRRQESPLAQREPRANV